MKMGMRKPSLKKSIKARTTGKAKRAIKKAVIPGYGKKGMGWINDPKKAAYNKVYNKTTFGINDILKASSSRSSSSNNKSNGRGNYSSSQFNYSENHGYNNETIKKNAPGLQEARKIGAELGVENQVVKKAPKFVLSGVVLILLGFAFPILLLPGLICDIIGLKTIFTKEYKAQNIWQRSLIFFVKEDYIKAEKEINKLSEEEKSKEQYKLFIDMINDKVNNFGEKTI